MHLVEVHLRNWRSFRNASFIFPKPDNGRNVILVGAQNGVGKTSLLTGLYLGLFGRDALHLIEGIRISGNDEGRGQSYKALLERSLHRPALRADDPYASVRLKFEGSEGESVVVHRRWQFSRGGRVRDLNTRDGEEVIIEVNGDSPKAYSTWQDANARVSELLFPANVMPCFFFDGEQAQERVEAAGGRALLDAVNTLYGTGLLDQLKQSLQTFINNERNALRRDVGNIKESELDQKRDEVERAKKELDQVASDLTTKRREHEELQAERQRLTNELVQLVGDRSADITEYSSTIKALETEQLNLRQKLTLGLGSLALPMALARTAHVVAEIVGAEQIRDRWLLLKEEATGKAERIISAVLPPGGPEDLNPPLQMSQETHLRKRLEEALEALWSPPPEGCAEHYRFVFMREADRAAVLSKIQRLQKAGAPDVAQSATDWSTVNLRLRETQRKFENIKEVQPQLQSLKQQIEQSGERVSVVTSEINALELRDQFLNRHIKELRGAIGQMEKRQSIANPVEEKLDVAYRVTEVVDMAKEQLIPLCKEVLERRCTYHFAQMISDEYRNFTVRFDADTEPRLENGTQVVYVTSLSGAQKRAFGLAFTLAVADVSRQQAPIVIDTPVGNMDSRYRDRVLRHVAAAAPGQVIFLSHDEEISQEYRSKLSSSVLKTILCTFKQVEEGTGDTSVIDDKYFGMRHNERIQPHSN